MCICGLNCRMSGQEVGEFCTKFSGRLLHILARKLVLQKHGVKKDPHLLERKTLQTREGVPPVSKLLFKGLIIYIKN